jgi:hypothetical protein
MAEFHSMMTPVAESEINNWVTVGAATMTKNRIIVNPAAADRKGLIYSKY